MTPCRSSSWTAPSSCRSCSRAQATVLFQPVVRLPSGSVAGYEALGRGRHVRLPEQPLELFRVAAAVGAEAELSRLFREMALSLVQDIERFPALFVNVHPSELETPTLVPDVVVLREKHPQLRLTLEVHEGVLADLASVDRLRTQLSRAGVGIAYDDFGAWGRGAAPGAGRGAAPLPEVRHAVRAWDRQGPGDAPAPADLARLRSRATCWCTRSPRVSRPPRRPRSACASALRTHRASSLAGLARSARYEVAVLSGGCCAAPPAPRALRRTESAFVHSPLLGVITSITEGAVPVLSGLPRSWCGRTRSARESRPTRRRCSAAA